VSDPERIGEILKRVFAEIEQKYNGQVAEASNGSPSLPACPPEDGGNGKPTT